MDLQVVTHLRTAAVTAVRASSDGLILAVVGERFTNVTDVKINGISATSFIVYSPTSLVAESPREVAGNPIRTVVVTTNTSGQGSGPTVLSFAVSNRQQVSGVTYTIQSFLMLLLATPGSDVFSPNIGGGLRLLIGLEGKEAKFRAEQSVRRTLMQMQMAAAATGQRPEDAIAGAKLLDINFNRQTSTLSIRVQVTSSSGQVIDAGATLSAEAV